MLVRACEHIVSHPSALFHLTRGGGHTYLLCLSRNCQYSYLLLLLNITGCLFPQWTVVKDRWQVKGKKTKKNSSTGEGSVNCVLTA